ncbi:hypothetical protein NM208_g5366 [Fusarium decemcellulare]|uniref:Uncharacterized protein n=1 Tax=Fusarium decemcellulare TaxID=57161 RepID=A0ACC1SHC4_9HYPO|nr:hypothetical protein NM208_g5366 [Fusarium decemcellulare]
MCLAQCKWNWVGKFVEPLVDFDRLDAASRGPWGSARLLLTMARHPHWISLGAFSALLLLGFEPFLQAIVNFEDQAVALNSTEWLQIPKTDSSQAAQQQPTIGSCSILDSGIWSASFVKGIVNTPFTTDNGTKLMYRTTIGPTVPADPGMRASIWNGLSGLVTQQNLWPTTSCTSGNCSWENFPSIAVCSKCQDISRHVKKKSGITKVPDKMSTMGWILEKGESLPEVSNTYWEGNEKFIGKRMPFTKYEIPELSLNLSNYNGMIRAKAGKQSQPGQNNSPDIYMASKVTLNPGQTFSFRDSQTMLAAVQFLKAGEGWRGNKTTWEDTPLTAQECSLHLCVNEYESAMELGVLKEKVVSSWFNRTPGSLSDLEPITKEYIKAANHSLYMGPGWRDISDLQIYIPDEDYKSRSSKFTQQKYNITHPSIIGIQDTLQDGFYHPVPNCTANCHLDRQLLLYPLMGDTIPPDYILALGESTNVSETLENVALSMSKWIRDKQMKSSPVTGIETRTIVVTRVEWGFLGVPAATILLGFIFVVLSIWETSRLKQPIWKDNTMALLAHSPEGIFRQRLREAARDGTLSEVSRKTRVAMEYHDGRGKLVSRRSDDEAAETSY